MEKLTAQEVEDKVTEAMMKRVAQKSKAARITRSILG